MIKNVTKRTVVVQDFTYPNSLFEKARGMIGKDMDCLILKTRFGIHTFFMERPIGILVLDRNKKVVKMNKKLSPNRFFFWNIAFNTIVELKVGLIESSRTEIGDYLDF